MDNISLPLKNFNDKVRAMNQTQKKDITLSAMEARNLHNEIFVLLAQIAELSKKSLSTNVDENLVQIGMDGGGFK